MKYLVCLLVVCVLCVLPGYPRQVYGVASCNLCILEVQTLGSQGQEDQEFVVIANVSGATIPASSTNPIRLQYINDQGVAAASVVIASSAIPKDKVYVLVSGPLAAVNAGAQELNMPLYSGGGTLQIQRGSSVYDTVGWGSAVNAEEAAALPPIAGMTLARRQAEGVLQDTNSNYQDFYPHDPECAGQEIQEIQPFVTDEFGRTKDAWVEVASYAHGPEGCLLITKAGDVYEIPSVDYAPEGLNVIASGIHASGQTVPLHIGEDSGQVWIAGRSSYADVRLPVSTQGYANIANGQSYAVIDGIWRRTYTPTPGLANVYTIADVSRVDPNACAAVRISEIAPNPIGEDTGSEWLEITNEGDQPAQLWDCVIVVGGSMYYFLPDDVLGPQEWRAVYELHDADQKPKTLSLRNSGTILVALQRLSVHTAPETLQSFEYADAPEGQSWARFADGWRWVLPTPDLDNTMMPLPGSPVVPTEYPADPDMDQEGDDATTKPLAAHISITELLPNPAAPATDDADEFVELFNGSDEPVRLRGYKLQTGNSYNYTFTFTDHSIPAKGYLTVTSGASSLSLANSGGRARLVSADGAVVHETAAYTDAPEGVSWAFIDGAWKWTAALTPGAVNALRAPVLTALSKSKASTTAKSGGAVKSAAKTSTTPAKTAKTASTASTKQSDNEDKQAVTVPPLHPLVLAVVGGLGVLYAAYEYRQDIANKIYQFRRDRKNRRSSRAPLEGRGAD